MKKLLVLVIPALVFMLAGCSIGLETQQEEQPQETQQEEQETQQEEQETQQEEQPQETQQEEQPQEEDLPTSSDASSKQQIELNREIEKQKGKVYDTNDDYIRGIMKKDPSKLNPKELAIYHGVIKQKNRYLPHGHFEEFQKIQNETERELSQGELDDEYRRRNQLPQHQEPHQKQQQQQQVQETQKTQQVPTERDTTKHETVEAEKEVRKTEEN